MLYYANPTHQITRVVMIMCIGEEPDPPADPDEYEAWCESGRSGRPVQTHVGNAGIVLWTNPDGCICVEFEDGDQRLLFPEEIEYL